MDHWSSPNGCHPDCPACAEDAKTITITLEGGCIVDVENLPDGWNYEIVDLDDQECECEECARSFGRHYTGPCEH